MVPVLVWHRRQYSVEGGEELGTKLRCLIDMAAERMEMNEVRKKFGRYAR